MEIKPNQIGELIIEGKTKRVFGLSTDRSLCYVVSKDRITAGDGTKVHEMKGKAVISTATNCAVFEFLSAVGIKTAFVSRCSGGSDATRSFVARRCQMVPIEWVTRRIATGSFLRRHPHVKEGLRFAPPKQETFFKDDENHDPIWSMETLISAGLKCGNVVISEKHCEEMLLVARLVFESLERVWREVDVALIDMKIEFGIDETTGQVLVADVIDNDSWRIWPSGDKKLMLDKQMYRDLVEVSETALEAIKEKFQQVATRASNLFGDLVARKGSGKPSVDGMPLVAIVLGSVTDVPFAKEIKQHIVTKFDIDERLVEITVCSAHKTTEYAIQVLRRLEGSNQVKAIVAVAGLSNGLGPVASGNVSIPVINCPPGASKPETMALDAWSSLRLPSGLGAMTVLGSNQTACAVGSILATHNPYVWCKIKAAQCYMVANVINEPTK